MLSSVRAMSGRVMRGWHRPAAIVVLGASMIGSAGCDNAAQGGLSGAGLGALGGMAIGSLSGDMGKGAVIGAVVGGIGGLIVGDQNERNARNSGR